MSDTNQTCDVEALQRELAELKAENIRLILLLNELETGMDFDEEIF